MKNETQQIANAFARQATEKEERAEAWKSARIADPVKAARDFKNEFHPIAYRFDDAHQTVYEYSDEQGAFVYLSSYNKSGIDSQWSEERKVQQMETNFFEWHFGKQSIRESATYKMESN